MSPELWDRKQECRGREACTRGQEGDFVSAGGEECRVERGREKDAENWKKGTREVGELSETTV